MIIARAPLRISFFGGGSDLPSYYRNHGGAVLSTTIDKSVYIAINKKFDHAIRLSYSKTEIVPTIDDLQHILAKEILKYVDITNNIEIVSIADIPSEGTGLGSSSSYTVAMLHALYTYKNQAVNKETLAQGACNIEIEKYRQPIGKQDQYAAAYGGLNFIEFNTDDTVNIEKLICYKETKQKLQKNLLMLYTGMTRSASGILQEQNTNLKSIDKIDIMKEMVNIAYRAKKQLEDNNLDNFGKLLHESRVLKQKMSAGITNTAINYLYERAREAGAVGGKILGAGGGGFLLLYAPYELHGGIKQALAELRPMDFAFDNEGSKILFYS